MPIQWTSDLSVGNKEIDSQHQELFNRVDALIAAMGQARGKDEIGEVVSFLEDYVVTHFRSEEIHMARYFYPDAAEHKAAHAAFVEEFGRFKGRFESSGATPTLVINLDRYLVDWLFRHIGIMDKALGSYLSKRMAA